MKKIWVINPNHSAQMTADIQSTVRVYSDDIFSIRVTNTPKAPEVLESFADYTMAGAEVIRDIEAKKNEREFGCDGIVLACMGDPCLYGIKEVSPVPVLGVAEAAISTALLLGYKFSIIAASEKAVPMMESMVTTYGLGARLASVESIYSPISGFLENPDILRRGFVEAGRSAMKKGAEVLILGCAGMTMLAEELKTQMSVPVIDPVVAGVLQLKAILSGGINISKVGYYKY